MSDFMSALMIIIDPVFDYIGTIANTIMNSPILLMTTGLLLLGGAIGIFGRLLSRG